MPIILSDEKNGTYLIRELGLSHAHRVTEIAAACSCSCPHCDPAPRYVVTFGHIHASASEWHYVCEFSRLGDALAHVLALEGFGAESHTQPPLSAAARSARLRALHTF